MPSPAGALHWRDNQILLMRRISASALALLAFLQLGVHLALGWDYEGHRAVNQLALASLPANFPAFVREPAAAERIAFLAGEMDRWRNTTDLSLKHYSFPDHYMDLEELADYGLKPELLPIFRYDFVAQLALIRQAHPEKFPEPDPNYNQDHTRGLVGFLPWAITESVGKLKSNFSYYKAFEEAGTPDEIANAQANIIYVMGVMGHLPGDASQPLHTTIHHHGWIGDNPNHYTTSRAFHSWIDGGFFNKTGGVNVEALKGRLRPAHLVTINGRPAKPEEMFQVAILFLMEQNKLVEPLYQLEKDGKLTGEGEMGLEGKAFLEGQLLKSGQLLGDIWFTAWQQAPPDLFLKSQLARRNRISLISHQFKTNQMPTTNITNSSPVATPPDAKNFIKFGNNNSNTTQSIKADTIYIGKDGQTDAIGQLNFRPHANGYLEGPTGGPVKILIFRSFGTNDLERATKLGLKVGIAYLMKGGEFQYISDVDLKLTDQELAKQFGIETK